MDIDYIERVQAMEAARAGHVHCWATNGTCSIGGCEENANAALSLLVTERELYAQSMERIQEAVEGLAAKFGLIPVGEDRPIA